MPHTLDAARFPNVAPTVRGQELTSDEIQLVHTYRGLPREKQGVLLRVARELHEPGPVCAWRGCGKPLTKVRPHQRFCNAHCRYQEWREAAR